MKSALAVLVLLASSCVSGSTRNPYAQADSTTPRDTARAERLTREAAALIESDPQGAEALLREALGADLFHGPAHNNLGVLFLARGELYEAATEFEWARKLMPGHPDPRLNLALCLERAGRITDAEESYLATLEVAPGYLPGIQGLARLHARLPEPSELLPKWLQRIAMEGETEAWRNWAREQLALRSR